MPRRSKLPPSIQSSIPSSNSSSPKSRRRLAEALEQVNKIPTKSTEQTSTSYLPFSRSVVLSTKTLLILAAILLLGLIAAGYKYYMAQQEIAAIKQGANQNSTKDEVKKLLDEVSKLYIIPQGEEPTVATISDIEKLKNQPFFRNAKNGDKVIIFNSIKRAILYDPVSKKIVDIVPVNVGTPSAQQSTRVILRNGTTAPLLTNKFESQVTQILPKATVTQKEMAAKTDYSTTIVVALSDNAKAEAETLAKSLNTTVGNLPEGETRPTDADIVVILGQDNAPATPAPAETPEASPQ
jgi:hypothetical protein